MKAVLRAWCGLGNIDHFGNAEMNHWLIAKALIVCVFESVNGDFYS